LTIIVRGIPRRKVYGHALLQLRHLSDPLFASSSQDVELIIYSSVSDQLVSIILDQLFPNFSGARTTWNYLVVYEAQYIDFYRDSRTTAANLVVRGADFGNHCIRSLKVYIC